MFFVNRLASITRRSGRIGLDVLSPPLLGIGDVTLRPRVGCVRRVFFQSSVVSIEEARMLSQRFQVLAGIFGCGVFLLSMMSSAASAQTAISGGFEINLLPGYAHEPLQGIDSIVGKVAGKDGVTIMYEIGPVPKEGALLFGGSYTNQAIRLPEGDRQWLKQQIVGRQTFDIAYSKDQRLIISTAAGSQGVNLHAEAKTPEDIADVLLMTLTLAPKKPK
jgi:hypothetical protein